MTRAHHNPTLVQREWLLLHSTDISWPDRFPFHLIDDSGIRAASPPRSLRPTKEDRIPVESKCLLAIPVFMTRSDLSM